MSQECGLHLCGLGSFWGHQTLNQYLSLMYELFIQSPFPINRHLAQHRYRDEGISLALSDVTNLIDSTWEASPTLRSRLGIDLGEQEEEGEWELGFINKITKVPKNNAFSYFIYRKVCLTFISYFRKQMNMCYLLLPQTDVSKSSSVSFTKATTSKQAT